MNPVPRVLVVLHDTEMSGAPRVALRIAGLLRASGRDVELATPGEGPAADAARQEGFRVHTVGAPTGSAAALPVLGRARAAAGRVAAIARLALLLRRRRFDLCWAGSTMAYTAVLAAALARVPSIAHIHETLEPTLGNRARIAVLRRCCRALAFVAPSCRRGFGRRPAGQRWRLLPNAIESAPPVGAEERAAVRASLGAAASDVVVLCVAFISPRKGIDVLLEAFRRVLKVAPGTTLWIAGGVSPSNEAHAAALEEDAREEIARGKVRFLGERGDVPALMGASDLFVLPSRNEALPLTILEAMEERRAVVATRVGSVGWLCGEKTALLVAPEDPGALAEALSRLVQDAGEREARGQAGWERGRRRFSPEAQERALAALLRQA
jgi:glycosyltransferase involved in cell wall biosynthesis